MWQTYSSWVFTCNGDRGGTALSIGYSLRVGVFTGGSWGAGPKFPSGARRRNIHVSTNSIVAILRIIRGIIVVAEKNISIIVFFYYIPVSPGPVATSWAWRVRNGEATPWIVCPIVVVSSWFNAHQVVSISTSAPMKNPPWPIVRSINKFVFWQVILLNPLVRGWVMPSTGVSICL